MCDNTIRCTIQNIRCSKYTVKKSTELSGTFPSNQNSTIKWKHLISYADAIFLLIPTVKEYRYISLYPSQETHI